MTASPSLNPARRSFYMQLLKLSIIVLAFLSLFVVNYAKYLLGFTAKDGLPGEWVGTVNVEPIGESHPHPPQEHYGNAVMRLHLHPAYFSFLDRLSGSGEITDDQGSVRRFSLSNFIAPFHADSGRISTNLSAASEPGLSGVLDSARFTADQMTVDRIATSQYQIRGILRRGDDATYSRLTREMESLGARAKIGN